MTQGHVAFGHFERQLAQTRLVLGFDQPLLERSRNADGLVLPAEADIDPYQPLITAASPQTLGNGQRLAEGPLGVQQLVPLVVRSRSSGRRNSW